MTELKVGDRVVVNKRSLSRRLVGLEGTVIEVSEFTSKVKTETVHGTIWLSHYKFDLIKPKQKKGLAFFLEKHSL